MAINDIGLDPTSFDLEQATHGEHEHYRTVAWSGTNICS